MQQHSYFTADTLEQLKQEYRTLAKKWHPDVNEKDTNAIFREIKEEYETLFEKLKQQSKKEQDKAENAETFTDIVDSIINLNLDIEIIGSWVWVWGNTFAVKETLKATGFRYTKKHKTWYHSGDYTPQRKKRTKMSIEEVRQKHGSQQIKQQSKQAVIN